MRSIFSIAIAAATMAALPGAASAATVINFDVDGLGNPIAGNTAISNQYANLGVLFAGFDGGQQVDIRAAPDPDGVVAPSAPNVMTNCLNASLGCPSDRADVVQISFAADASDISLMLSSLGSEEITFNLYDGSDNLLESLSISSGGSVYIPVAFSASGVRRIDGLQPNDFWAWAFDDLTFTSGVIPEPGTWAMLIAGFGLVGFAARRRRVATIRAI